MTSQEKALAHIAAQASIQEDLMLQQIKQLRKDLQLADHKASILLRIVKSGKRPIGRIQWGTRTTCDVEVIPAK